MARTRGAGPARRELLLATAGAFALPLWAPARAQPGGGAKDLFFGQDNPALVDAQSLRPRRVEGSPTAAPPPAAPASAAPAAPRAGTQPGLRVWLAAASDTTGARRLSPQQTFKTGERFRLWLESNRDGHLYLVNVGTSGQFRVMFPRPGQDNRVTARTPFTLSSPIVFGEPAGTEQLIAILASAPIEDAGVPLKDGGTARVGLRPGAPAATPVRQPPAARPAGPAADAASLDLALADLKGSKDLKFEDDGNELIAVSQRREAQPGRFAPVVVNLRLTHRP